MALSHVVFTEIYRATNVSKYAVATQDDCRPPCRLAEIAGKAVATLV